MPELFELLKKTKPFTPEEKRARESEAYYQALQDWQRGGASEELAFLSRGFVKNENNRWIIGPKPGMRMRAIEVVAAVIRDGDRVFATQRGYGDWKDYWEFPGGKIEPGETPEEALVREIREELGAEIAVDSWLTTVEYDYPAFHLHMRCFLCRVTDGELTLREHEAARWLSKDELDAVAWLPADRAILPLLRETDPRDGG